MLSIPVINSMATEKTRPDYVNELRRAGADRVFICPSNPFGAEPELTHEMELLKENLEYFTREGFKVGVWIGGLGHGGWYMGEKKQKIAEKYVLIKGLNGGSAPDSFCPLGEEFRKMYIDYVKRVAMTGTPMIMIDDDFRISLHGSAYLSCACDLHIKEFNRRAKLAGLQKKYTHEDLTNNVYTGKPNVLRDIWLGLQGDTMKDFAGDLRKAVDSVDSNVRLGQCACLSTWDADGSDSIEISKILAGNTKPFLRLIGAPYWVAVHAFGNNGIGCIIDTERMQAAWCSDFTGEAEIFSEGDVYPRPRYKTPSVLVECFDQVLLAEGMPGILKYMLDYEQEPLYETGYIDRHVKNAPLREEIKSMFSGKISCGIYVHEIMHKAAEMDYTGYADGDIASGIIPASAKFANALSLPTFYRAESGISAGMIFGGNAIHTDKIPAKALKILDFTAAKILAEKGTDTGFDSFEILEKAPSYENYPDTGIRGMSGSSIRCECGGRFYNVKTKPQAKTLSFFNGKMPSSYLYTNADGETFLVYCFDMVTIDMKTPLIMNYYRQAQLYDVIRKYAPDALPASLSKEQMAYILCKKNEKELSVGIWNFGEEICLPENIRISSEYKSVKFIRAEGTYDQSGRVSIDTPLMPYQFAGFVASK